jgi:hypothetical protein
VSDGFVPDAGSDGFVEDAPVRPEPSLGQKALNMIGRGAWALPGLAGLDHETVQAAIQAAQGGGGSFGERFDKAKAAQLALSQKVDTENPITSGLVRGVAATPGEALAWAAAPEVKLAQGAGMLRRALAYGPRLGALAGATEYGTTAYKEPAERLMGAATTGGVAGLLGGAMAGALPNPAALAPARSAAERMRETAINQGRKVLTGNAAPMSTRKPLSPEAIQAAYDTGAIRPLGTVEGAASRLAATRETLGDQYSQVVAALEAKGITGPDATDLAVKLLNEAQATSGQSLGSPKPGLFENIAEELVQKPTDASGRLGLSQAENMKRTLQRAAQSEYTKEGRSSLSGEAHKDIASRLRQAIEDEVTAQSGKAPAEAAAFEPIKRQLGAIIEASTAANRGAARAANRQQFGLGSKVLAGGALASGSVPGAVAALVGSNALRNRGPATVGWTANQLARALEAVAHPSGRPMSFTPQAEALVNALRARLEFGAPLPAAADSESNP